ncbi:MAG TPA: hypothetical protein VEW69_12265 [Alphaproteobacteria bacterium]|nr:hypothetical protein [Alphaproteobacteria bacterium]
MLPALPRFPTLILIVTLIFSTLPASPYQDELAHLRIEKLKTGPAKALEHHASPGGKYWYATETAPQTGVPVFDTTVYISSGHEYLLKVPLEGHAREWGVSAKWKSSKLLLLQVEWGHVVSYEYVIDVAAEKQVSARKLE